MPPLDVQDMVVRLEGEGITDAVASADFGYSSTWVMARHWYPGLSRVEAWPIPQERGKPRWQEFLKGISFALPLALCAAAMVLLAFSLWGGDLPADLASAVAVGTVGSFVVSGGTVQAMARRGRFYFGIKEYLNCAQSCRNWFWAGLSMLSGTSLAFLVLNVYFGWFPTSLALQAVAFHLSLGLLWLAAGLLYMLEANLLISAAVLAGIACVGGLHFTLGVALLSAQLCGILLAALLSLILAVLRLRDFCRKETTALRSQDLGKILYLSWPYFAYGTLYYVFLFADRLLAWTVGKPADALPLTFRGDYETALDIALFAFVLLVGWVHVATVDFYEKLNGAQNTYSSDQTRQFNQFMVRYYVGKLLGFVPLAVASCVCVFAGAIYVGLYERPAIFHTGMWALAGYAFLVVALYNVSLLFALSRPIPVLYSILSALVVDVVAGYLLSRLVGYEAAVGGFVVGAVLFACLTTYSILVAFSRLDYWHFSTAA